jgi:hypothetical protein
MCRCNSILGKLYDIKNPALAGLELIILIVHWKTDIREVELLQIQ